MDIHVVKQGETVSSIARRYSVPTSRIISDNGLLPPYSLAVGQTLLILFPKVTHTVVQGDSAFSIAKAYNITLRELYRNNPALRRNNQVFPGQTLVISYTQKKIGAMEAIGYAYPFIDMELLRETVVFLTYLIPFTYGMTPEGELIILNDTELINTAKNYGTGCLMHLSTLTAEGIFSTELGTAILSNEGAQDKLLANILETIKQKGFYGLDIDFEFLGASNAQPYVNFVSKATKLLNQNGYVVYVALAPKTSADQPGLLYEGHDYKGLGQAANAALLMTYEWGYLFGPPMAVAPLNKVREVVEYAITEIPPKKLLLGIPNYGYDWPLPYVRGTTRAATISNVDGINIAIREGAEILYDAAAASPFYNYTDAQNVRHEVWFEDARSIRGKLALVTEFGLKGTGYWNMMKPFPQNWMLLNVLYNIN